VLLLFVVAFGFVACELLTPAHCELTRATSSADPADDACVCCCAHIVVEAPLYFEPASHAVVIDAPAVPRIPLFETPAIERPPQA